MKAWLSSQAAGHGPSQLIQRVLYFELLGELNVRSNAVGSSTLGRPWQGVQAWALDKKPRTHLQHKCLVQSGRSVITTMAGLHDIHVILFKSVSKKDVDISV